MWVVVYSFVLTAHMLQTLARAARAVEQSSKPATMTLASAKIAAATNKPESAAIAALRSQLAAKRYVVCMRLTSISNKHIFTIGVC